MSAILDAVYSRDTGAVERLLAAGPALNVFEAAALGRVERMRELLDAEPGLATAYAPDGFTALQLAAHFCRPDAVRLLLERGADVAAVARQESVRVTALHAAAAGDDAESARLLLDAGSDVDATQPGGSTALHAAAQNGNAELVALLLERGADAAAMTEAGKTAADVASEAGQAELASRLRRP